MAAAAPVRPVSIPVEVIDAATVRFCGDSGDGIQVVGAQLTQVSAQMGNAVSSLPDFPAEIRAPAGTLAGVSGFQVHFSSYLPAVPGDFVHTLVAMNPAALYANRKDLQPRGNLIVNADSFTPEECAKAGYERDPLADRSLHEHRLIAIPMDRLNREAVAKLNLTPREADRCRNFFALGIICWLYDRALEPISSWIKVKFATNPVTQKGNSKALKAGYHFAESCGQFPIRYRVPRAPMPAGTYRHLTGTTGTLLGIQAAARQAGRRLVFACTPMTPASDLLHGLQTQHAANVCAVQAEDDSAAAALALGAAFGGAVGVTATSGAGLGQMAETIGLAVMTELPLVIIDVQRCGPSTGMPTKTEQTDLLQAIFGRNGESPLPVLAPASPSDCFAVTFAAVQLACRYMTPVIVLTDLFLANGSEPWRVPELASLPTFDSPMFPRATPFRPYDRDPQLARSWALPGTPDCEHRIGGLEKEGGTGNVSYDPLDHEASVKLRQNKIAGIVDVVPELVVDGPDTGDLLILSWGSTHGAIAAAVQHIRRLGRTVAQAHLRHLHPLPRNTGAVLKRYRRVLVPELNNGQLRQVLRAEFLVDAIGLNKVRGQPFQVSEIIAGIDAIGIG